MLKDKDFWEEFYKEEPVDDDLLDKDMDSDADQTELLEIAKDYSESEEDNDCLILELEPYEDLLVEDIGLRILEVDVPDDEKGFTIDSVKNLRIPGYKRNVYRKSMPIRRREHKVIVPRFIFDKATIKNAPNDFENSFRQRNLQIFENYVMRSVKEQFKYELESILSAYALPQCMMKTILANKGITPGLFETKTGLSHTVHARITKKGDLNLKLSTLINICWSLKIEYPIAKRLIEAYGYNLNGTTKNIIAYKYVLKYMMHWNLETVEQFLEDNDVPLFK